MTFNLRMKLQRALILMLLPPFVIAALYLYGSTTGCSGGSCTGTMMGIMFLGVLAVPLMFAGLLYLIDVGLSLAGAWVRRRFDGEAD